MENLNSFSDFKLSHGMIFENFYENQFPSSLYGFTGEQYLSFEHLESTYYGFVLDGNPVLKYGDLDIPLKKGMYFCIPGGNGSIHNGSGMVIEKLDYRGIFSVGGPIEEKGRLKYIDGCTDSLLIPPIKKGDPCLNALYFPSSINQTQHTHPSDRIGLVFKGHGFCITPTETIDLLEGHLFIIHQEGIHSFRTESKEELVVIAFHPDSDFGPEDENHPMINRTMVNGLSANQIEAIRTK